MVRKTPVILDTDIGTDIDDTWALIMMLNSPELDVKLIVSATGQTARRAAVIAKLLDIAGRTDIPVGVGLPVIECRDNHMDWANDYDLASYPAAVHADGVGAIIDTIMQASGPVTLIGIGPAPNIAAALEREPRIAAKARFVGMFGSVRKGYNGSDTPAPEYNVLKDIPACRKTFAAPWDITITPVDTCGLVRLTGEKYQAVKQCRDPLIRALMDNYRLWCPKVNVDWFETQSSILFDTVAIYLAFADDLLDMESLDIGVTDDGLTVIDNHGKVMRCAMTWKDLPAFEDFLVARLTKRPSR